MSQYGYRRKDGMYGLDADLKRKNDAKYKQDDEDEARAWLSALLEVSLEVRPPLPPFGCWLRLRLAGSIVLTGVVAVIGLVFLVLLALVRICPQQPQPTCGVVVWG